MGVRVRTAMFVRMDPRCKNAFNIPFTLNCCKIKVTDAMALIFLDNFRIVSNFNFQYRCLSANCTLSNWKDIFGFRMNYSCLRDIELQEIA